MIDFNSIGLWVGIASGVFGILGGIIALLKLYKAIISRLNEFYTTDRIINERLNNQDDKIGRIDGDIQDLRKEMLVQHTSLREELTLMFTRIRNGGHSWDKYVEQGIISKEQLDEIRKNTH